MHNAIEKVHRYLEVFRNAYGILERLNTTAMVASELGDMKVATETARQALVLFNDILSVVDYVAPYIEDMHQTVTNIAALIHSINQSEKVAKTVHYSTARPQKKPASLSPF